MDSEIDDVMIALCLGCSGPFTLDHGWQGCCPSCCALSDEHLAGRHHGEAVIDCRHCQDGGHERLRDIA